MAALKQGKGGRVRSNKLNNFDFQKLLINVGRNVKEYCALRTNLIISCAKWRLQENGSIIDCDRFSKEVFLLIAKVTARSELAFVFVYWLTYHVMYKLLTVKKCDFDWQFLSHSYLLNFSPNFLVTVAIKS